MRPFSMDIEAPKGYITLAIELPPQYITHKAKHGALQSEYSQLTNLYP